MNKIQVFVLFVILLSTLTACAPGSNIEVNTPDGSIQLNTPGPNPSVNSAAKDGKVASIWQGLWHGIISPVTLVLSFFNPDVQMYEVHNIGKEYNLGFLIGVAIVFLLLGFMGGRR